MTSKGIRQLQAFSSAIRRTFYQIHLTACSRGSSEAVGLLVLFGNVFGLFCIGFTVSCTADRPTNKAVVTPRPHNDNVTVVNASDTSIKLT